MRDYLLGVLSAVVAAIALAWRHGLRYHEVAAQPRQPLAIPAFLFQPNVTLADALKTAYEDGLVDGIAKANTDYERGRADAFRLLSTPSLN